jgi:hypothetical protein
MNKQHPIAVRRGPVFWNNMILRPGMRSFKAFRQGSSGARRAQFNKKGCRADGFPIYEMGF